MIPSWAPNVHPILVHFPIVLLITAVATDLLTAVFQRQRWLTPMTTSLYVAGATAAGATYWTGLRAAAEVFVPGMAHPVIDDHRIWALATTAIAGAVAVSRVVLHLTGRARRQMRLGLLVVGLLVLVLVQQTAERGARLVYEQGVGVIAAPGSR